MLILTLLWTIGTNIIEGVLLYIVMSSDTNAGIKDKLRERFSKYIGFDTTVVYIENFVPFLIGVQLLFIYYTFGKP